MTVMSFGIPTTHSPLLAISSLLPLLFSVQEYTWGNNYMVKELAWASPQHLMCLQWSGRNVGALRLMLQTWGEFRGRQIWLTRAAALELISNAVCPGRDSQVCLGCQGYRWWYCSLRALHITLWI